MRHLRACDFGKLRRELLEVGLSPLQRVDLPPDRGFTAGVGFLVLEVLGYVVRQPLRLPIADATPVLIAAALVKNQRRGLSLPIRLEGDLRVNNLVEEFGAALR